MINQISSQDNPLIKLVNSLKHKKYRDKEGLYLVEGTKLIDEVLEVQKQNISKILVSESFYKHKEYMDRIINRNIETYVLKDTLFNKVSETTTPQGILAVIKKQKPFKLEKILENKSYNHFLIVIDELQDPGNMGTIIRTAHASGCHALIVFKGSVDVFNPKTIRATMGSIFHVPIIFADEKLDTVKTLKKYGLSVVTCDIKGEAYPYETDFTGPVAVVVGNEAKGASREVLQRSSIIVKIPMPGGAESLNAAVASGIITYEVIRQRKAFLSPIL